MDSRPSDPLTLDVTAHENALDALEAVDAARAMLTERMRKTVNALAGRRNLDMKLLWSPTRGKGQPQAPAWFSPATNTVTIDTTVGLGAIDPAEVNPLTPQGRQKHPVIVGLAAHEAAHARHTRWTATFGKGHAPVVVAMAVLLEEPRIEAHHLVRRPQDRPYLRAQSVLLDVEALGGGEAIPGMARARAAEIALMTLGRLDAGVLEPEDAALVLPHLQGVLGEDLGAFRALWSEAIALEDRDVRGLLGLGRRWVELLGEVPAEYVPAACGVEAAGVSIPSDDEFAAVGGGSPTGEAEGAPGAPSGPAPAGQAGAEGQPAASAGGDDSAAAEDPADADAPGSDADPASSEGSVSSEDSGQTAPEAPAGNDGAPGEVDGDGAEAGGEPEGAEAAAGAAGAEDGAPGGEEDAENPGDPGGPEAAGADMGSPGDDAAQDDDGAAGDQQGQDGTSGESLTDGEDTGSEAQPDDDGQPGGDDDHPANEESTDPTAGDDSDTDEEDATSQGEEPASADEDDREDVSPGAADDTTDAPGPDASTEPNHLELIINAMQQMAQQAQQQGALEAQTTSPAHNNSPGASSSTSKAAEKAKAAAAHQKAQKTAQEVFTPSSTKPTTSTSTKTTKTSRSRRTKATKTVHAHRDPTPEERQLARTALRALSRAQLPDRATERRDFTTPPGRMRGREAMIGAAQRAQRMPVTAKPFRTRVNRYVAAPPITLGIMIDISGSMRWATSIMSSVCWAFSYAMRDLDGTSAAVTFGHDVTAVTAPGVVPRQVTAIEAVGMGHVFTRAFAALDGGLNLINGRGARILVVVSDGEYGDAQRAAAVEATRRLHRAGGLTLWIDASGRGIIPEHAVPVRIAPHEARYITSEALAEMILDELIAQLRAHR